MTVYIHVGGEVPEASGKLAHLSAVERWHAGFIWRGRRAMEAAAARGGMASLHDPADGFVGAAIHLGG